MEYLLGYDASTETSPVQLVSSQSLYDLWLGIPGWSFIGLPACLPALRAGALLDLPAG